LLLVADSRGSHRISTFARFVFVVIVVILDAIIAPLLLLYLLWKNHETIRNRRLSRRWGSLFDAYLPSGARAKPASHPVACSDLRRVRLHAAYYWEVPSLLRRSIFVALDVVLFAFPIYKLGSFIAINLLVFLAHSWKKPFHESFDNSLESISLFILFVLSAVLTACAFAHPASRFGFASLGSVLPLQTNTRRRSLWMASCSCWPLARLPHSSF
jgi:hypothetical protein